jgi:hypothetical protein
VNTLLARDMAGKHAVLIEMVSIFQCRYGKDYRIKPGSPADAWELYQSILDHQVQLARLLDVNALENPIFRLHTWWKFQDVMDVGVVFSIGSEINHLIACCACSDADPALEPSPVIQTSQRTIAGMLHPSAILMAQDSLMRMPRAS